MKSDIYLSFIIEVILKFYNYINIKNNKQSSEKSIQPELLSFIFNELLFFKYIPITHSTSYKPPLTSPQLQSFFNSIYISNECYETIMSYHYSLLTTLQSKQLDEILPQTTLGSPIDHSFKYDHYNIIAQSILRICFALSTYNNSNLIDELEATTISSLLYPKFNFTISDEVLNTNKDKVSSKLQVIFYKHNLFITPLALETCTKLFLQLISSSISLRIYLFSF